MERLGYLLITVGFLWGSYLTVVQKEGVPLVTFVAAVVVGGIGVALARTARHRAARSEEVITANIEAIEQSLGRLVEKVARLEQEKDSIDVYELRHHIDREMPDELDRFVVARESIAHSFGLQAYADVMNPFAAGERYLNRVWSTSTDGYVDEAHTYLTKSREQFEEALAEFRKLERTA